MKITISKENYLKAIAEAESEGDPVIAATVARRMDVSAPAVTMALRRLRRDGLLRILGDGRLELTASGREIAGKLLMRHYLIERMLCEMFGMEWYKVHEEAEQMEHAVSADFERRLLETLGCDAPCPHGNRVLLEGVAERRARGHRTLDELTPGESGFVSSVYERDRALLEQMDAAGVRPGVHLTAAEGATDLVRFKVDSRYSALARSVACRVWLAPAP